MVLYSWGNTKKAKKPPHDREKTDAALSTAHSCSREHELQMRKR